MSESAVPADPGLMERFRSAGEKIQWRPVIDPPKGGPPWRTRVAHLNDEEARVQDRTKGGTTELMTDSGPLGALVLILEVDRRGAPSRLVTHEAGEHPGFRQGALAAVWGRRTSAAEYAVSLSDLVGLARYALA